MKRLLSVLLFAAIVPVHAETTTYLVEARHTQGVIRWNHLGFSYPTAQFALVGGKLVFDPAAPAKATVSVAIPLSAMTSGVPALDEYLRSDSFFDLAKFPQATFASRKVEKGKDASHFRVSGDLTVHGITRPAVLETTLNKIGINPRSGVPSIGFEATTVLKRSDFGLGLYVPQVGDEVEIHITCQANEAKAQLGSMRSLVAGTTDKDARKEYEKDVAEAEAEAKAFGIPVQDR